MSRESNKRKHMGKQKENVSIRVVQDIDEQEEHWRSTNQEYWKVKRDVEIEKLQIGVEKEKIKKKMLREIYEELKNKNMERSVRQQ